MTRCECACASSSVALYDAIYALEANRYKNVLVIGVEKMNLLPTPQMTHVLACSSHWPSEGSKGWSFPMLFAAYAKGYQKQYGISNEDLERMLWTAGALCYKNGAENPLAHVRNGPATIEDIMKLNELDAKGKCKNVMIARWSPTVLPHWSSRKPAWSATGAVRSRSPESATRPSGWQKMSAPTCTS